MRRNEDTEFEYEMSAEQGKLAFLESPNPTVDYLKPPKPFLFDSKRVHPMEPILVSQSSICRKEVI